jgi:hypothetical protein
MEKETIYIPLDDPENYFYTPDLGCSAALLSDGFDLVSVDKETKKAIFIFKRSSGIGESIEGYWNDSLKIKARTYFDNIKAIKNWLYSK